MSYQIQVELFIDDNNKSELTSVVCRLRSGDLKLSRKGLNKFEFDRLSDLYWFDNKTGDGYKWIDGYLRKGQAYSYARLRRIDKPGGGNGESNYA